MGSGRFVVGPYAWRPIPNVGHFPQEEALRKPTKLILDWLASDVPWNDPRPAAGPAALGM